MKEYTEIIACLILGISFIILGFFMFFMHIPKSKEFKYYRYSRYTLGTAFLLISLYCFTKTRFNTFGDYTAFSFHMLFSLLFSWLTYLSFLFIIYVERFKRRQFILDGIIPLIMMLVAASAGLRFPQLQQINSITFGLIFGGKCAWMAYNCVKEYYKVVKNLHNYYEEAPDLKWMHTLLLAAISISILTIISFYVPSIHIIFYPFLLCTYFYMTIKLVNYIPIKISGMRAESVTTDTENKVEKKKDSVDLKEKLEPVINRWVEEKGFVKPNLTIKDVAIEIGTNQNYLSRYINSIEGVTFSVWLHRLRIEESKKLLLSPEKYSIEEVGKSVGISELYNYSRWFKIITEMTPQQYRKQSISK